jgi:hypothetical protein
MRKGIGIGDIRGEEYRCHHTLQLDVDPRFLAVLLHYCLVLLSWCVDGCLVDELQFFAVLDPDSIGPLLPAVVLKQLARLIDVEIRFRVVKGRRSGLLRKLAVATPVRP